MRNERRRRKREKPPDLVARQLGSFDSLPPRTLNHLEALNIFTVEDVLKMDKKFVDAYVGGSIAKTISEFLSTLGLKPNWS